MKTDHDDPPSQSPIRLNSLGQPVGPNLSDYAARSRPQARSLPGQWCSLTPLSVEEHSADLFAAFREDAEGRDWTYLSHGPFRVEDEFKQWLASVSEKSDPLFFSVIDAANRRATGILSLMRIDASSGSIEIGNVHFSRSIQKTRVSTEAVALLSRHVFEDLAYRRLEWKCDSLNEPSRRAALRFGFKFEGLFRQHVVYKHRSRDTAWYSMLDWEWPERRDALLRWLEPSNFDERGNQRLSLAECREKLPDESDT
jgi:RimJ/RimL family protein N-acetyltransferase